MPRFTIITPTYNNGATLEYAIESLKRQDFDDYEHLIVGDGVIDAGREIATRYAAEDARAHFFDNPKGARHGEAHRDDAIRNHASGELVCYLSDDDLWFPNHLSTLDKLIGDADFAHTMTYLALADGRFVPMYGDMNQRFWSDWMQSGENFVAPSTVAHTRAAYLRLETGWTPETHGSYGDLTVWQQFLRLPDLRVNQSAAITSLHPPAGDETRRAGADARLGQLVDYLAILSDPARAAQLRLSMYEQLLRHAIDRHAEGISFRLERDLLLQQVDELSFDLEVCRAEVARRPQGLRDAFSQWRGKRFSREGGFGRMPPRS